MAVRAARRESRVRDGRLARHRRGDRAAVRARRARGSSWRRATGAACERHAAEIAAARAGRRWPSPCDVTRPRLGRAGDRGGRRAVGPDRRPGQQRRRSAARRRSTTRTTRAGTRSSRPTSPAVFRVTREAAPFLPEGGRVINLSSVLGRFGVAGLLGAYCASKHGVIGLTRAPRPGARARARSPSTRSARAGSRPRWRAQGFRRIGGEEKGRAAAAAKMAPLGARARPGGGRRPGRLPRLRRRALGHRPGDRDRRRPGDACEVGLQEAVQESELDLIHFDASLSADD